MLVTREADYAIRCVLEVARHGRISAAEVARLQDISPTFLGKIVQSLARAGILATRRGVGGGITLAVPIEAISLLRVIEAVEGPLCVNDCLRDPPMCLRIAECPAYSYLCRAQESLRAILDVDFATLLATGPPSIPFVVTNGDTLAVVDGEAAIRANGQAARGIGRAARVYGHAAHGVNPVDDGARVPEGDDPSAGAACTAQAKVDDPREGGEE